MCSWQFDGQCSMARVQVNFEAAMVPSWGSVALPENVIFWPTAQVSEAPAVVIVATGGVFPTLMTRGGRVDLAACGHLAGRTVTLPTVVNVCDAVTPVSSYDAVVVPVPVEWHRVAVGVVRGAGVEVDVERRRARGRGRGERGVRRERRVVVDRPDLLAVVVGVDDVAGRRRRRRRPRRRSVSPERRRLANCSIEVKSGVALPLEAGANQMQRRV